MGRSRRTWSKAARWAFLLTILAASSMAAVAQSAPAQRKTLPAAGEQESKDPKAVRSELYELLWPTPKLTKAIGADPTLLADEAYVSRSNPELAEFLRSHPEVVRNPEFYLFFSPFPGRGGPEGFEAATVWSELQSFRRPIREAPDVERIVAFLLFVLFLAALVWIFRIVLEHNKWNKLSKMQNELYGKLLDKCGTNEELLASFRTSAGKPFFDLAAIEPRTANPLTRVFLPLQFGIVLAVTGGLGVQGFLSSNVGDSRLFVGLGTLVFALGIGLIISAVVSYLLARRLGLLPRPDKTKEASLGTNVSASPKD